MSRVAGDASDGVTGAGRSAVRARGAVASPHDAATAVGRDVLAGGGTAMDAAVAVNAMLAVLYPHMCGIGGDAFFLYFEARSGKVHCLNGTGPAPALASRHAFADRGLDAVPARGPLSVTVPGAVRAWDAALQRFGSRPLVSLLEPSAHAAETGVEVSHSLARWMSDVVPELQADPILSRRFLAEDGKPLRTGGQLRQPELARSLRRIADAGADAFYAGEIADDLDRSMLSAGGLLRATDLNAYQARWVRPLSVRHGGLDVITTPPNSQGVTALLMLDHLAAHSSDLESLAEYVEAFVTAKRAAFAIRDRYVTDPDHMPIPAEQLLRERPLESPTASARPVGGDTVYFCTSDSDGNVCSGIQSIYYAFGSAYVAGETGILLQNRGHYFSLAPDHPNRLDPGRRTLHTLMACLALDRGRPRFAFGAMGADGQPQFNVQVLHQLLRGASAAEAVSSPRVLHGRFLVEDDPDVLHVEADIDPGALVSLQSRFSRLKVVPARDQRMGHAHALAFAEDGHIDAGADPRSDGSAAVIGR